MLLLSFLITNLKSIDTSKILRLLEQQRQIQYHHNRWWSSFSSGSNTTMSVVEIPWIETLLQIPIPILKNTVYHTLFCHIL